MRNRVFVTGIGIVSSLGHDLASTLYALKAGRSTIRQRGLIGESGFFPVAEFDMRTERIAELLGMSGVNSRTALLGCMAANQALIDSKITPSGLKSNIGFISGTSVDIMDSYELAVKEQREVDLTFWKSNSTQIIANYIGVSNPIFTISTACTSSANAILLGARLVDSGVLDYAIVGGCDALCMFTLKGFASLQLLDRDLCKPFDSTRNGLNLGEGAAYLVLESERTIQKKEPYCAIIAGSNRNDAFHATGVSPTGLATQLCIKDCLHEANLHPKSIDYINMHGTGTQNNDASEVNALINCFGATVPDFSSTKEYTGHTLGAAGAIEAVISILTIRENLIFPNSRFSTPMPDIGLTPVSSLKNCTAIKTVISNSLGFGGNNVALIFQKV